MTTKDILDSLILLAQVNVQFGGGPFSSAIYKNGQLLGKACNNVTKLNDPTSHAEVCNIREVCKELGTWDLSGCTLYASCKPCQMCEGAIYWANIKKVFYAATPCDAEEAGFKDKFINEQMTVGGRKPIPFVQIPRKTMNIPFQTWISNQDKKEY